MMQKIRATIKALVLRIRVFFLFLWKRFTRLPRYGQALVVALLFLMVFGLPTLFKGPPPPSPDLGRAVTVRSVGELSGNVSGASVVGVVRSLSEAALRAEAGGTVRQVNTALGASVPAGFVLAELENASERAQVTQAEGAYDAAIASRAAVSPIDVSATGRNAYRTAFETLDTTLETQVDAVFGAPTPVGPDLLINPVGSDATRLSRERKRLSDLMNQQRETYKNAEAIAPDLLLADIEKVAREVATFVNEVAQATNATNSGATSDQIAAITAARVNATATLSGIIAAQATLRSGSSGSTALVDASVKSALGALRLAEAALEKTRIRAPIAGTVNYLPIRVGDYVGVLDHVATVAQNGALEIVAFVSEDASAGVSLGDDILVEGAYEGTITSLSPALDPVTKQVELRASVGIESGLVNGQSVRFSLPGSVITSEVATNTPILLPLSSVKLSGGSRVVFTRTEEGRLSAISVEIGEVVGERIEIHSALPLDLRIVVDARGLSDGQEVRLAE